MPTFLNHPERDYAGVCLGRHVISRVICGLAGAFGIELASFTEKEAVADRLVARAGKVVVSVDSLRGGSSCGEVPSPFFWFGF